MVQWQYITVDRKVFGRTEPFAGPFRFLEFISSTQTVQVKVHPVAGTWKLLYFRYLFPCLRRSLYATFGSVLIENYSARYLLLPQLRCKYPFSPLLLNCGLGLCINSNRQFQKLPVGFGRRIVQTCHVLEVD